MSYLFICLFHFFFVLQVNLEFSKVLLYYTLPDLIYSCIWEVNSLQTLLNYILASYSYFGFFDKELLLWLNVHLHISVASIANAGFCSLSLETIIWLHRLKLPAEPEISHTEIKITLDKHLSTPMQSVLTLFRKLACYLCGSKKKWEGEKFIFS